jgi:CheY-like chemotaxis protein
VGAGTEVTVYFPITKDTVAEPLESEYESEDSYTRYNSAPVPRQPGVISPTHSHPSNDSRFILLVDDEPLFQSSARRLIHKMGYQVYVADSGDKALEIYQKNNQAISLILLDMLMPGLSGTDTFYKLKDINPQAKILIISGFDRDENVDRLLSNGASGYLQKPFSLNSLSREFDALIEKDHPHIMHPTQCA